MRHADPHPHLSVEDQALFAERRKALMQHLGDGTVAVIPSARMTIRNRDVEHDFRQESTFFYLTGFDEPDSLLVLKPGAEQAATLFVRPRDKAAETWTGRRAGVAGAVERFGLDDARPIDEIATHLPALFEGAARIAYTLGADDETDRAVLAAQHSFWKKKPKPTKGPDTLVDLRVFSHAQRLIKSAREIADLQRASLITAEAHHEVMRCARPVVNEYELQAALEYVSRAAGATRLGYSPIVASGDNATILHYNTNRMVIPEDALVLIDAGAEYNYVTADVTRTFPASGHFTPEQRAVYDVVLAAERASIAACTVGSPYKNIHDISVRVLVEGLVDLGLLSGSIDELIETQAFKRFYMHGTGHWLGMDVHDVGRYDDGKESLALRAGMVLTIEPGIYVDIDDEQAPAAFRGIGVRIEDDICVTEQGPLNLTEACVKEPEEVEEMVQSSPRFVRPVHL
ncbi:MAG TPA: Xaa-Pro aminopeptidase [Myxococcales bacterium]|nr:Xaa-Pro aminopeptidase [Myxococcales bacterium]